MRSMKSLVPHSRDFGLSLSESRVPSQPTPHSGIPAMPQKLVLPSGLLREVSVMQTSGPAGIGRTWWLESFLV